MRTIPVEAVVRGYLEGSGWKEYQESGSVCGIALPKGLKRASKLPHPIFTPATKAEAGQHDENITFEQMAAAIGEARAREVRDTAVRLYEAAAKYALGRGIIIADTKFEFGTDAAGKLHLIDEALTPDSSRFWPLDTWREGASPESFDKQYVRNWLDSIGFERKPPAPPMPGEVARRTSEKYQEALRRLASP
jgi:phosphoribosylaminoimidazole-succinocarboxamide synthase